MKSNNTTCRLVSIRDHIVVSLKTAGNAHKAYRRIFIFVEVALNLLRQYIQVIARFNKAADQNSQRIFLEG